MNQEDSKQNEVDGMKKGADYTGMFFINRPTRKIVVHSVGEYLNSICN